VIRIHKPKRMPSVLKRKGTRAQQALGEAYTRDPLGYSSGKKSFKFDSAIYRHDTVERILRRVQFDKCAFCESSFAHISYGDIEHFRPKAGWRQRKGDPLQRPGYYWLAYTWANLFLSCTLCNQQFKKNFFPLKIPSRRARSHMDDVATEEPLLIDPAVDDPEALISFREEVPFAVNGNARGKATLRFLGLHREKLAEQRRKRLDYVKALQVIAKSKLPESAKARAMLQRLQQDSEEYASMTRAFLRSSQLASTGTRAPPS
jgi:uncharacterized protein (TIGR02646 family)